MKQPDIHGAKRFIRPVTYGLLFGVGACMLLLVLMSVVMTFRDVPQPAITLIATLAFVLGGLVAGFVSASFAREKGMLIGICCGICLFLILMTASFVFDDAGFGMVAVSKLAAVLFASALGGVIGVNREKNSDEQDMLFQKMIEILSELWYDKYGIRFIGVHSVKTCRKVFAET